MIHIILVVALIGLTVWAIEALIPMPSQFHRIIQVVAVFLTIVYVLNQTGLINGSYSP